MMKTLYLRVDPLQPDAGVLEQAAAIIRQGGLVAFPTETVYGLGANGLDAKAVRRIFTAKGRPGDNPLILHIAAPAELSRLARRIPANAKALTEAYWPGPLTVVVERTGIVPDTVTAGLDTVAVRLPESLVARELIRLSGVPIAAPSANTSGRPSPTTAAAVLYDLDGKVDMVIDGGPCSVGLESTVVDCTTPVPTLLRPGGITREMLLATLGELEVDRALGADLSAAPRSPGMKYTHYAPSAPLFLVEADYPASLTILQREIGRNLAAGKRVGAIVADETMAALPSSVRSIGYGPRAAKETVALRLYDCLRLFDAVPVDVIFAEGIDETGIGLAVMNRLRKASGYQILTE